MPSNSFSHYDLPTYENDLTFTQLDVFTFPQIDLLRNSLSNKKLGLKTEASSTYRRFQTQNPYSIWV